MNTVNLFGRLTDTPVLRETSNSTAVANVTVAVNRGESSTFVPVTAFGRQAELLSTYLKKGDRIVVEGSLYSSTQQVEGKNISRLSVTANFIHFVEKPSEPKPKPESTPEPKPEVAEDDLPF